MKFFEMKEALQKSLCLRDWMESALVTGKILLPPTQ